MKLERTLFVLLLFAACQAVARQQISAQAISPISDSSASVTFTSSKPRLHWLAPAKPVPSQKRLQLISGLDPRAWTTVAEKWSGKSAFPSAETHEGGWDLLRWGAKPSVQ
jgi:hypothetical protein